MQPIWSQRARFPWHLTRIFDDSREYFLSCIKNIVQESIRKKWRIIIGKSRQSQTKTAFVIPFDRVLIVRSVYSIARALSSLLRLCRTCWAACAVSVTPGRVDLYDARYGYSAVPRLVRRFLASGTNVSSRQSGIRTQRGRRNDARRAFYKCIYHIFGRAPCWTGKIKAWMEDVVWINLSACRRHRAEDTKSKIDWMCSVMFSRRV